MNRKTIFHSVNPQKKNIHLINAIEEIASFHVTSFIFTIHTFNIKRKVFLYIRKGEVYLYFPMSKK